MPEIASPNSNTTRDGTPLIVRGKNDRGWVLIRSVGRRRRNDQSARQARCLRGAYRVVSAP
jgi:hypothetical protein